VVKRLFDVAGAAIGIVVCAPLLAAAAIAVKLQDGGPILYRGERVGLGGKPFRMLKFRTMVPDAERSGASSTADDDPRITRVGRWLRRAKLDELPQLVNVLAGHMSFVGPRPQVPWAVALYTEEQKPLLSVRPGMTDYASIRFSNEGELLQGSVDPDGEYLRTIAPEKIRLGLQYVEHHSLLTDLRILLATARVVAGADPERVLALPAGSGNGAPKRPGARSMTSLRTSAERQVGKNLERIFLECADPVEIRLENFPKYVRRQHLKRFLAMYEVMKLVLPVKGSIVECGVYRGFGLMSWAKLSTILEPENLTRRVYGFDTFEGFPAVSQQDAGRQAAPTRGDLHADSYAELEKLIKEYDADRFLGHLPKVELVRGDIAQTVPAFLAAHPHLVVSLLFLDCDLYESTKVALEHFLSRMPKGAVLAFDELDNPQWPGETVAAMEAVGLRALRLQRLEWDPYIAYAVLE